MSLKSKSDSSNSSIRKPTRRKAEDAVRTIIKWTGENPDRDGLVETPRRVVKMFEEVFRGYDMNPQEVLRKTFSETQGYDDIVSLTNISFTSYCEHHMAPITGVAHVAYIPNGSVVGISKLARVVEIYSKRLQIQERLTNQIGSVIDKALKPKGVAVMIDATHHCISTRGINKHGSSMKTSYFSGYFKNDRLWYDKFINILNIQLKQS